MTETATTPAPRRLETKTCGRCGGSGHYSYNQISGTTCFGCGGSGRKYTARGLAAAMWLKAQKMRKARDIEFGMWVVSEGMPGFTRTTYFTVDTLYTRLETGSYLKDGVMVPSAPQIVIEGVTPTGERTGLQCSPDYDVKILVTKGVAKQLLSAALDYQDTLTAAGKPRNGAK